MKMPRRPPKLIAVGAFLVLTLAGAALGVYRITRVSAHADLTLAPARKGEFLVMVRCRGELRARRSVQVPAPTDVPELRIVWLAPPSSAVNEGDVVARFDLSSAQQKLKEHEAALNQAQAALEQATAEARITAEKDKRDLAAAKYEVERARLEVSKQEVVSVLQAEEAKIDLGLAEEKLRVMEATVAFNESSSRSKVASAERARDQAREEVDVVSRRLTQMELKAPGSGIIIYMPNYSQGWVNAKPFKVGDQVWPGVAVAEIPDLATLEMEGKVEEIDRGRISVNDGVRIRVDALPELTVPSSIDRISALTQLSYEWPPKPSFRASCGIAEPDERFRPGMNGDIDIIVDRIPDAISIPAKALFTRNGRPVVYVLEGNRIEMVQVKVIARNPDEVAVEGIAEGDQVSLMEPQEESESQT